MARDFAASVAAFANKANISTEKAIRGTSIALFGSIIQSTPVLTGHARANWQVSGATPASGMVSTNDTSGAATISKVTMDISSSLDFSQFTLTNNLPYITKLEYGSSAQAPHGMVRINVARFEQILNKEVNNG